MSAISRHRLLTVRYLYGMVESLYNNCHLTDFNAQKMARSRHYILLTICLNIMGICAVNAQGTSYVSDAVLERYRTLFSLYGNNKELPKGYEKEALIALSYFPELKGTRIKFQLRKSHSTLKTRANWLSMLGSKDKRQYVITISTRSSESLDPVLFDKMTEEQRVGILGHELSHVADFEKKSTLKCLFSGISHISPSYVDSLEYHTDQIAIAHGLGKQLEMFELTSFSHAGVWQRFT